MQVEIFEKVEELTKDTLWNGTEWVSLLRTKKIKILKKPIDRAFSGKGANLYVS